MILDFPHTYLQLICMTSSLVLKYSIGAYLFHRDCKLYIQLLDHIFFISVFINTIKY
jgi:hypothetical protein